MFRFCPMICHVNLTVVCQYFHYIYYEHHAYVYRLCPHNCNKHLTAVYQFCYLICHKHHTKLYHTVVFRYCNLICQKHYITQMYWFWYFCYKYNGCKRHLPPPPLQKIGRSLTWIHLIKSLSDLQCLRAQYHGQVR